MDLWASLKDPQSDVDWADSLLFRNDSGSSEFSPVFTRTLENQVFRFTQITWFQRLQTTDLLRGQTIPLEGYLRSCCSCFEGKVKPVFQVAACLQCVSSSVSQGWAHSCRWLIKMTDRRRNSSSLSKLTSSLVLIMVPPMDKAEALIPLLASSCTYRGRIFSQKPPSQI